MAPAKLEIAIAIEHAAWKKKWPQAKRDIAALLRKAAARDELRGAQGGVVSVVLANDETLQRLNRQFRRRNKPTNVLSFPDSVEPFGGIAVAYQTVLREAGEQNKKFVNHAKHMILHGFLHLLGYDHILKRDARLMEGIEIAILSGLGIPNPFLIEKTSA
ncbi:MAG: rRNA maturation RNase YbeY [Alphaproteobacteria bacterium]|nr:rRNA maturation RNase YbeY [Alphaproteobacteria bacterium]